MSLNYLFKIRLSNKILTRIMAIVALIGVADTVYLTTNYYFGNEIQCLITKGCEVVLTSQYSKIFSIPLMLLGLIFYVGIFILVNTLDIYQDSRYVLKALVVGVTIGFAASLVFLYIQLFILKALCFYCLISLVSSTTLFILVAVLLKNRNKI